MIEFYPQIKLFHVMTVVLSGLIFAARGLSMLFESPLANHPVARYLSYTNDTVLLTAGLLLMNVTRQYPVEQPWLSAKLSLLIGYIIVGSFALRRGRTKRHRAVFFALALLIYLFMFSVARSHHPWGVLSDAF